MFNLHRARRPFPPSSLSDRAEAGLQRKKGGIRKEGKEEGEGEQSAVERASPPGRSASGGVGSNKARTRVSREAKLHVLMLLVDPDGVCDGVVRRSEELPLDGGRVGDEHATVAVVLVVHQRRVGHARGAVAVA